MDLSISQAFETYRTDYMALKGQSKKTEESYQATCKRVLEYFGDVQLVSLTFSGIRDWKMHLDKGRSPDTVRGYVVCLRVILEYYFIRGYKVVNPKLIPLSKRKTSVPEYLSPKEVSSLIKLAGKKHPGYPKIAAKRNMAIVSLLYASGIRVSELCDLNTTSIKDCSFTIIGKGDKARLCFIDGRTKLLLKEYLSLRTDNNRALFININTHERMTSGSLRHTFSNMCKRSGFNNIHPHTLRHSYATNLMRNGMHIYEVSRLMGHSSIQTTQVYLHITDRHLQSDYAKYHTV